MKIFYLITTLLTLFLIGCSSTYKASDFPSKDKFYDDFNKSARDKSVEIILNNDSSFTDDSGAFISNDSLSYIIVVQKEKIITKNEIKNIIYSGTNMSHLSATILLKDSTTVTAKNINIWSDSSINIKISEDKIRYLPIFKIKTVSYKNIMLGGGLGFLQGTCAGFALGRLVGSLAITGKEEGYKPEIYYVTIQLLGTIGGTILGITHGYVYTYQFNP